jgi:predicted nucleic acid-binding protein
MTKTPSPTHLHVFDDSAAKACCRAFGLRTLGTGAILILGKQNGLPSSVREPLEMMRAKGMWIADSVIDLLRKRASEK